LSVIFVSTPSPDISFFYIPIQRRTIIEQRSINFKPVVANFVSKSDLWKTFDKTSRAISCSGKEKNPLNNSLVGSSMGIMAVAITLLKRTERNYLCPQMYG